MSKTNKSNKASQNLPLKGVKVVDLSRILAGPYCTQILAELGAEVIKIERPGRGDDTRSWGPPFKDGLSAYFISCNKNKYSLCLDLNEESDQKKLHKLLKSADVMVHNFLPDVATKLGVSPKLLRKKFPQLIVASISGFGWDSPKSDVPGYDFAIQALSGLMSITGDPKGSSYKVGVAITDILTGMYACIGILARLASRKSSRKSQGVHLDLALLDCAVSAQINLLQSYLMNLKPPGRQGNRHAQIAPYEEYFTKDGSIVLCVGNDDQWSRLCSVLNQEDWISDVLFSTNPRRVKNREILSKRLNKIFNSQTSSYWEKKLLKASVPHGRVHNYQSLSKLQLAKDRDWFGEIKLKSKKKIRCLNSPIKSDSWTLETPFIAEIPGENQKKIL